MLGELAGIDAGAQEAAQDEGARVQLHGAHDEVRMADGNAPAVATKTNCYSVGAVGLP